jgi:hypothetical protein
MTCRQAPEPVMPPARPSVGTEAWSPSPSAAATDPGDVDKRDTRARGVEMYAVLIEVDVSGVDANKACTRSAADRAGD